jgi:hypothetical protein
LFCPLSRWQSGINIHGIDINQRCALFYCHKIPPAYRRQDNYMLGGLDVIRGVICF